MEILYASRQLKKLCTSERAAVKKYGERCARTLIFRVGQMKAAENVEDLIGAPGHFHPLTADRKGQWACRLQGGLRLVFAPGARGEMVIKEITDPTLTILKIVDYHH